MTATIANAIERLRAERLIPVLRFGDAGEARFAVEVALTAGFGAIELTFTIPGVLDLLRDVRAAHGHMLLLGIGTALQPRQGEDAFAAGADFVVSPCFVPGLAAAVRARGKLSMVGAFTPSEVRAALAEGADVVKIFPASSGGPRHLEALASVFPGAVFCPTGGISAETVGDYLRAGAAFVGIGGNLFDKDALARRDLIGAAASARRAREAARSGLRA